MPSKKLRKDRVIVAIGRRKSATASVRLIESPTDSGSNIIINNLSFDKYFSEHPLTAKRLLKPFELTSLSGKFQTTVKVKGGGKAAQIEAVALGIARAIVEFDLNLKPILRREGFMTRDPREKERKKPGFLGARKKPQFSKR